MYVVQCSNVISRLKINITFIAYIARHSTAEMPPELLNSAQCLGDQFNFVLLACANNYSIAYIRSSIDLSLGAQFFKIE